MTYSVLVLPSAERDLRGLPLRDRIRVVSKLEMLSHKPRPPGVQKLHGSNDRYRIRQGRFRILYRIDDAAKRVFIYAVGDRKHVYR
jgi:mRNA interferase RelE/StbE